METAVAVSNGHQIAAPATQRQLSDETMTALVIHGDLSKLNAPQKVEYYRAFCARVGLDPATQPFKLLTLNGKQILYCDRGGTAQLNKKHDVSHKIVERKRDEDIYFVIVNASTPDGRQTESIGAVSVINLKGEALANAMMKAETKGKRRSTLDLLGLGMLDESEIEAISGAQETSLQSTQHADANAAAPAPISAEEEEFRKTIRKHRANFNKSLQSAKTIPEIEKKRSDFEAYMKLGAEIWAKPTFHNEFETWQTLYDEHFGRVKTDAELESPEGIQSWLKALDECGTTKGLAKFVNDYRTQTRLMTVECEDALQERARYLGMMSYTDVEESGNDEKAAA